MAKRMILMLSVTAVVLAVLGFVKFQQFQAAAGQAAAFQPPPEAVTTIVARQDQWPASLSVIGTAAAVQGVTVSADTAGHRRSHLVPVRARRAEGDVLVELDTRQEQAQLAAAEAQRDLARLNFERMEGLVSERGHLARRIRSRGRRKEADRGQGPARSARRSPARRFARRSREFSASARSISASTCPGVTRSCRFSPCTRST